MVQAAYCFANNNSNTSGDEMNEPIYMGPKYGEQIQKKLNYQIMQIMFHQIVFMVVIHLVSPFMMCIQIT